MADHSPSASSDDLVPADVVPRGKLPSLRYRDLPEPVPIRRMVGPGIILAGLSLGSGEFILWPYITYQSGFVFFWACILGVTTQYFINMEITRWTLATGESAITGFCRLSRHWAWVFLLMNTIPWVIPAWAKGAAHITSWLIWGVQLDANGQVQSPYVTELAIAGLFLCGLVLTAGPVIYETVERVQFVLVAVVLLLVVILTLALVRPDAVWAQAHAVATLGDGKLVPEFKGELTAAMLLGALAFAGCGGTLNLGQSNYVKDKGYGMGAYIGRITSPITGQQEAISGVGYLFPSTDENLARWKKWWRRAGLEHFVSFYLTCVFCLIMLTLISYSIFYQPDGTMHDEARQYGENMEFVFGEAVEVERTLGSLAKIVFLIMGIVILMTTEFGVLDVCSRVSCDIVKVNWLRSQENWTESRLYYCFLWGTILVSTTVLLLGRFGMDVSALGLFKLTAAMNGGVMFLYSMTLLYLNRTALPQPLRISRARTIVMIWSVLFFGFFMVWTLWDKLG